MAGYRSESSGLGVGTPVPGGAIEPSIWNALLYFTPLAIFPLLATAAIYGGWWIVAPFVYFWFADYSDILFGTEKRNMDPEKTPETRLFLYRLSLWLWAALWPVTFVFSLWQILVVGHLSTLETVFMAVALAGAAQTIFIVGHELIHQRSVWERRAAELLLANVSYPQYATEHVYVHHNLVCMPADPGSAPKGQSFWRYLPRDLAGTLVRAWRFERNRLARRHLPVWHYTNPFWRYFVETAAWYVLVYWMGGPWVLLIFAVLCFGVITSMKIIKYVQHYGLRRVRMRDGRFEGILPRHSWSAADKVTNLLHYNMQRHPDHHTAPSRPYPLLQHHGESEAPQLPGSYVKMAGLAMAPRRWFETMDPLVDRWRAHFYPQIDDWTAYDSSVSAERPEAFDEIAEIFGAAPRLAEWCNRAPELLDSLREREFADLDLPDGFGPDPEFEAIARHGIALLYWTREFGVPEMRERIADYPFQGVKEAVETARNWSNDKVFQIGVMTMRGNLSPVEAGTALSNVAEASITSALKAVEEEFAGRGVEGGGAVVVQGDFASGDAAPGAELDVLFVYDRGPAEYYQALCRRFLDELDALSRDNLLFAPVPRGGKGGAVLSLADFTQRHRTAGLASELLELTRARCVFTSGDAGIGERFDEARREILTHGAARAALIAVLRKAPEDAPEPGLFSIDDMHGGFHDIDRAARFLQLSHVGDAPDILVPDAVSVLRTAGARGWIPAAAAERLAKAARLWQNLRGILRLVETDNFAIETAGPKVKAVIARSCGMDDFGALGTTIRETAFRAAGDIDALDGMLSNRFRERRKS